MCPPIIRPTLLAATIAAIFPAHAQQRAADVTPEPARVEVRGAAAAYDARRDDTASKIVVNHDEIVKYGDTSVADVLKRVPGVTISGSGPTARCACAASATATRKS